MEYPLIDFKGVGPKSLAQLNSKGYFSALDLLFDFPKQYEDRSKVTPVEKLKSGRNAVVFGVIKKSSMGFKPGKKKWNRFLKVVVDSQGIEYELFWFFARNAMLETYASGKHILFSGRLSEKSGKNRFIHPHCKTFDEKPLISEFGSISEGIDGFGRVVPVYGKIDGVKPNVLINIRKEVFKKSDGKIKETLPDYLLKKRNFPAIHEALSAIHCFEGQLDDALYELSRQRFLYEEIFKHQFRVQSQREKLTEFSAHPLKKPEIDLSDVFLKALPFELTEAQKRVYQEVFLDIEKEKPMNRLLQGDVGSGKTAVSFLAALRAVSNGYQAVIMAPTEVLADQHYKKFKELAASLNVNSAILKGAQKISERKPILEDIKNGKVQMVFGTHALFEKTVEFKSLAFVCVDEQHRFGVSQRMALRSKATHEGADFLPHMLVMSATPIPRTLSLVLYGDLDISILNELPPGRKPVRTRAISEDKRQKAINFLKEKLDQGEQAFYVLPLIRESEKLDLSDAESTFETLGKGELKKYKLGLLHGALSSEDKLKALNDFRDGKSRVLVSTTVIEVGVDIPSANVMIVENAERFGLSQLHQLRGRVGRGGKTGFFVLITSNGLSELASERVSLMETISDGFELAEKDFELRGGGDITGTAQSGSGPFQNVSFPRDLDLLKMADEDAKDCIKNSIEINFKENSSPIFYSG